MLPFVREIFDNSLSMINNGQKVKSKQDYSKIINYRIWAQGLFMNFFSSVYLLFEFDMRNLSKK